MEKIRELLEKNNICLPDKKVYIKIENSKEKIMQYGAYFVPNFVWVDDYTEIVNWLENNDGRGLFLYGDCGRGKTQFAKYILPAILLAETNKVLRYYDVQECKLKFDEIMAKKILSLDDIGTEEIINNYGTKIDPFAEIIDSVEKKSKLIVITSNLNQDQLTARYGVRILDRIKSTTTRVLFQGKSFRC
jgi:DNA replication protein DnaC